MSGWAIHHFNEYIGDTVVKVSFIGEHAVMYFRSGRMLKLDEDLIEKGRLFAEGTLAALEKQERSELTRLIAKYGAPK